MFAKRSQIQECNFLSLFLSFLALVLALGMGMGMGMVWLHCHHCSALVVLAQRCSAQVGQCHSGMTGSGQPDDGSGQQPCG